VIQTYGMCIQRSHLRALPLHPYPYSPPALLNCSSSPGASCAATRTATCADVLLGLLCLRLALLRAVLAASDTLATHIVRRARRVRLGRGLLRRAPPPVAHGSYM
jgi:hypothetical protein